LQSSFSPSNYTPVGASNYLANSITGNLAGIDAALASVVTTDTLNDVYNNGVSPNQGDVTLNANNLNPFRTITTGTSGSQHHLEMFNNTNASVNWGPEFWGLNSASARTQYVWTPAYIFDNTAGSESATYKMQIMSQGTPAIAFLADGLNQDFLFNWPVHIPNGTQTYPSLSLLTGDATYTGQFIGYTVVSDDVAAHNINIPATYYSTNADDTFQIQTQGTYTVNITPAIGVTINGSNSVITIPINTLATLRLVNAASKAWVLTEETTSIGSAINITDDNSTNATMYPVWVTANSGNQPTYVSSNEYEWNPSFGGLSIGTTFANAPSVQTSLNLYSTNQYQPRLVLSGQDQNGFGLSDDGVGWVLGVNYSGNKQFWAVDTAEPNDNATGAIRFGVLNAFGKLIIDGVTTDGTLNYPITFGGTGAVTTLLGSSINAPGLTASSGVATDGSSNVDRSRPAESDRII